MVTIIWKTVHQALKAGAFTYVTEMSFERFQTIRILKRIGERLGLGYE